MDYNTKAITMKRKSLSITDILIWIYFLLFNTVSTVAYSIRPYILVGTLLLIFTIEFVIKRDKMIFSKTSAAIILIFLGGIISSIINHDGGTAKAIQSFLINALLYLVLLSYCKTTNKLVNVLEAYFWSAFIGGPIIGLYQLFVGHSIYPVMYDDISLYYSKFVLSSATQPNSNFVALQIVVVIIIGYYLAQKRRNRDIIQIIYYIALITSLIALILTFSRTAIVASLTGLLLYYFQYYVQPRNRVKGFLFLIALIVMAIYFMPMIFDPLLQKITSISEYQAILRVKDTSVFSMRSNQWMAALEMMFGASSKVINIIFGYGANYSTILAKTGASMSAHNTILGILMSNGIICALLCMLSLLIPFKYLWRALKIERDNIIFFYGYFAVFIILQMISAYSIETLMMIFISSMIYRHESTRLDLSMRKIRRIVYE